VDDPGFAVDEDADAEVAADVVSASFTEDLATVGSFDASAGSLVQPAADRGVSGSQGRTGVMTRGRDPMR
jgi:hypothetical protein